MTLVKSIGSVPRVTLKETKTAKTSKRRRKRKRVRRRQNNEDRLNKLLWIRFKLFDSMVFLENSYVGLYKTM